jgi:DNA (cytosine-5)-methyltransferase 1
MQKSLFEFGERVESSSNSIKGVSLFANVGIAETYIKNHNIDIVVANELLEKRASFYKEHHPNCNMICGDISNKTIFSNILSKSKELKCDFLIATPPCQGMSIAGKMREDDPRNSLIKYVVEFIKELKPSNIIIENVVGILNTYIINSNEKVKVINYIESELKPLDYFINYSIVDTADYETPQTRKRAIFLISKIKKWEFPPKKTKITVKEAIGYLPSLESGESSDINYHYAKSHNNRHILWMKHTPTGKTALNNKVYYPQKECGTKIKGYSTTYKRIEWNKPSPTITMANGSISSQNNVHPGRLKDDGTYSDARVLTLKEIFILTGLPDNWQPPKWASENLIRQVIGEGIPPKLIDNLLTTMPR